MSFKLIGYSFILYQNLKSSNIFNVNYSVEYETNGVG